MLRYFFPQLLIVVSVLQALPSGMKAVKGEAAFISSSSAIEVSANGKTILHWDQFNIASSESVHFLQSQPTQAILNRVMQGDATQILGLLEANCPIYLINPQGVFIGSNACIDTAGFIASTADLSNESFWQGDLCLEELGVGRIINLGAINSKGDVYLIARAIDNQGTIKAPQGSVALVTHEAMLRFGTKQCIFIRTDKIDDSEEGIQNSGVIQALSVELNTRSSYEKAIQHTGLIEALAAVEQNGRIYLVAEEGRTVVDGILFAETGEIRVLGQTVLLEEKARINASGDLGGTILIGGDNQGKNPDVLNAEKTFVATGAEIHADAFLQGNGGKVIVWSDGITSYKGMITACGGSDSGDGGFVEVSGKQLLFDGKVNVNAPFGKIGTLLLDPTNVTIGAADSGGSFSGCIAGTNTFTPDASVTDTINAATLAGLLDAPCNVEISTVGSAGGGTGAITVSGAVNWSSATTLTLTAASFITVSGSITNNSATTGFTAVNMTANAAGTAVGTFAGITSSGTISTNGGNISLVGKGGNVGNNNRGVILTGVSSVTQSIDGSISVTGTSNGAGSGNDGVILSAAAQLKATGLGAITINGTGSLVGTTANNGLNITGAGTLVSTASGTLTVTGTGGGTTTNNRGVIIQGAGTISSASGAVNVTGTGSATGTTGNDGVVVTGSSSKLTAAGNGALTVTGTGTVTTSSGVAVSSAGQIATTGTGFLTVQGIHAIGGTGTGIGILVTGGSSNITLDAGGSDITGTSFASGSANTGITTNSGGIIRSVSGSLNITATGSVNGVNNCTGFQSANVNSVSGLIHIVAKAGGTGSSNVGINPDSVSTTSSSIYIEGTGAGSGASNIGINRPFFINAGGVGSITLIGTGSPIGTDTNRGINGGIGACCANDRIFADQGDISISVYGGGTGSNGQGLAMARGSSIRTNSGRVTIVGYGSPTGTVNCDGIYFGQNGLPSNTIVRAGGNIDITGIAGGTGEGARLNALELNSTSGSITVNGTGSGTGQAGSAHGITPGGGITIQASNGNISLTGIGAGQQNGAGGIFGDVPFFSSSSRTISCGGTLQITGSIAGTGSAVGNPGIFLNGGIFSSNTGDIILNGTGGSATDLTNIGIVLQNVGVVGSSSMSSTSGNIRLTGTAGIGGSNGILIKGQFTVSTGNGGDITIDSPNSLILQDGAAVSTIASPTGSDILINTNGAFVLGGAANGATISAIHGNITIDSTDSVFLTGGGAINALASISTVVGDINATASGNMALTGGTAAGAIALIQSTTQGTITLNAQNLDVQGGSAAGQSGVLTQSGDINVVCSQNCQYAAPTAGSFAIMQTLGSDLTVTTGGAINLSGFTIYSTPDPGNLLLIAGTDITIGTNVQVIANGTMNSSLTLVVDNAFPMAPNIGLGQFLLDLGGDVSTGAIGITPLRIYTARRPQNTISNPTINGMIYSAGPFAVNTPTEMWGIYYQGGAYGGVAFTIYYKEPSAIPPSPSPLPPYRNVALSLQELTVLLPVLGSAAIPFRFPGYHFQLCDKIDRLECDPIFSPYGSFIFEDDVYWIGIDFMVKEKKIEQRDWE